MERQTIMPTPDVNCYWKLNYYFWAKEIVWVILFIKLHSYAALCGCFLFGAYPFWRKYYRKNIKPIPPLFPYTKMNDLPYTERDVQQSIGRVESFNEVKNKEIIIKELDYDEMEKRLSKIIKEI